jgi:hypothetical protein
VKAGNYDMNSFYYFSTFWKFSQSAVSVSPSAALKSVIVSIPGLQKKELALPHHSNFHFRRLQRVCRDHRFLPTYRFNYHYEARHFLLLLSVHHFLYHRISYTTPISKFDKIFQALKSFYTILYPFGSLCDTNATDTALL